MFIRYFYSKLIFNWVSVARENKVIEMVEIADGRLPKGYPFRMDSSSFKERKCLFCMLMSRTYIRGEHFTWILIIHAKIPTRNLITFFAYNNANRVSLLYG